MGSYCVICSSGLSIQQKVFVMGICHCSFLLGGLAGWQWSHDKSESICSNILLKEQLYRKPWMAHAISCYMKKTTHWTIARSLQGNWPWTVHQRCKSTSLAAERRCTMVLLTAAVSCFHYTKASLSIAIFLLTIRPLRKNKKWLSYNFALAAQTHNNGGEVPQYYFVSSQNTAFVLKGDATVKKMSSYIQGASK